MDRNTPCQNIGLMTDHNPNLLVGLFGVLKSGNSFLPLDSQMPIERLDHLIDDSGIEVIVTEDRYLEKALLVSEKNASLKHIICLDQIRCSNVVRKNVKVHSL